MTVDDNGGKCPGSCSGFPYACAQIASPSVTSHGLYECDMKPSGVAGTVQTCVLASKTKTPYEEVNMKFIGNDTTHLSIGFYTSGRAYSAGPITLSFDASLAYHNYAFEWTSNYIIWYVDGVAKSSETGSRPIPTTPTIFIASLVIEETGTVTDDSAISTDSNVNRNFVYPGSPVTASFKNLTYTPVMFESCDQTGINPANTNYTGGYDNDACSTQPVTLIYEDSFATGWTDTGSTTHSLVSVTNVRSGSKAISWDTIPNALLYFRFKGVISQADYYDIEFWIYGGGKSQQQIGIQLLLAGGDLSPSVNLNAVLVSGVQAYAWSRVVLSFDYFGIPSSMNIVGFLLSSLGTGTQAGTIYLDQFYLGQEHPFCSYTNQTVYADNVAKNWIDQSYPTETHILQSTDVNYTGSYSIKWTLYNNNGIKFHTTVPVDTKVYSGLQMYVNYQKLQGWNINLAVTSSDIAMGSFGLLDYYSGTFPPGTWVKVVIPLYEFGVTAGTLVDGILITCNTGDYQGVMYIDDIAFVSTVKPAVVGGSFAPQLTVSVLLVIIQITFMLALF